MILKVRIVGLLVGLFIGSLFGLSTGVVFGGGGVNGAKVFGPLLGVFGWATSVSFMDWIARLYYRTK